MYRKILVAAAVLTTAAALGLLLLPETVTWDGARYFRVETQLNQFTKSTQNHAGLLRQADGSLLALWQSRRQESGGFGVYARRLDAWGKPLEAEFRVNQTGAGRQAAPTMALRQSSPVFAWESARQRGPGSAVYLREAGGEEQPLSAEYSAREVRPVLATLPGGDLLALWQEGRGIAGELGERELSIAEEGWNPALAVFADGSFAAAWSSPGEILKLACYSPDGGLRAGPVVVAEKGIEAALAATDGGLVLAWMQARGSGYEAMARRFDLSAQALGSAFSASGGENQSGVAVAALPDGRFTLAWNELSGSGADIMARHFDPEGGPILRVNSFADGKQALDCGTAARRLLLGDDGSLALAWSGRSSAGDKSSANLTLLLPAAGNRLARTGQRLHLAWQAARRELLPDKTIDEYLFATPHQPPRYQPVNDPVVEPEPWFPGSSDRDAGFVGITNTGWTPPDPHMAAGDDCLIGVVNGMIACFDKAGNLQWQEELEDSYGFWADLGADWFVFDPEVIYDPHSERFMVMASERASNHSYFDLAVSRDSYPDDADDWHKYRLDVTSIADINIDSPNIGVDEGTVYLTADFFGPNSFLIYMLDKPALLVGLTPPSSSLFHIGSQSWGVPVQYDADAPTMYMIECSEAYSDDYLKLWAVQDPMGSPSLISIDLDVDQYWRPINASSLGSSNTIETFEARFWSCVYRDGSLWACHHACPTSARQKLVARWYQIDMNGWPVSDQDPVLVQQGDVLPDDTGFAFFNSIAVNGFGAAAMNFTYSSPNDYFQIWRAYRLPGDPLGTMREPELVKASTSPYSGGRFGDYSGVAADPKDAGIFWTFGEYVTGGSWSTWFGYFQADATAVADLPGGGLSIEGIWPNPAPAGTRVEFSLARQRDVSLEIHDVRGRLVRVIDGGTLRDGRHGIDWDGKGASGHRQAAGTYFALLRVDGEKLPAGKILLLD